MWPQEKCGPTSTSIIKVQGSPTYPFPTTHDIRESPIDNQESHPHPALKSLLLMCSISGDHHGDRRSNNEALLPRSSRVVSAEAYWGVRTFTNTSSNKDHPPTTPLPAPQVLTD